MNDQKLTKDEILRGRKLIKWAFENGKTVYKDDFVVLKFCPYKEKKALFAVERGVRKAVKRNRIKRLLREYYRKNKKSFAKGIWIFIGKANLLRLKSHQISIPKNFLSPL